MIFPEQVAVEILEKMINHGYIGKKHISADNIPKGFPKHIIKQIKYALKELIRKGYVTAKPTAYGLQVSINPRATEEVKEFILRYS
jgi:hypothetical protein